MLHLITGANGAGKTLNTLKWVRERQLKENRAVYYNGRFEMVADFGWEKFEFKDWQKLPDGAIIFVDECHNDLPVRGSSAPVPEHVRMLAEHRRRGFDFYLITQHPQNLDLFVRRLIGSPGWHRHLKRTFGADLVSCLEWSAVNGNCEKSGAGKDAKVSMVAFPKEVYDWYKSASLHTGKKAIPKQVWLLGFLALLIPAMIWFAYSALMKPARAVQDKQTPAVTALQPGYTPRSDEKRALTPAEYAESFQPRIEGLPHTAARYDAVQQPVTAPKPCGLPGRHPSRWQGQELPLLDAPGNGSPGPGGDVPPDRGWRVLRRHASAAREARTGAGGGSSPLGLCRHAGGIPDLIERGLDGTSHGDQEHCQPG